MQFFDKDSYGVRGTTLAEGIRIVDVRDERAAVYMDGLAEMRKEFNARPSSRTSAPPPRARSSLCPLPQGHQWQQ